MRGLVCSFYLVATILFCCEAEQAKQPPAQQPSHQGHFVPFHASTFQRLPKPILEVPRDFPTHRIEHHVRCWHPGYGRPVYILETAQLPGTIVNGIRVLPTDYALPETALVYQQIGPQPGEKVIVTDNAGKSVEMALPITISH
jgi:hypothetical protein